MEGAFAYRQGSVAQVRLAQALLHPGILCVCLLVHSWVPTSFVGPLLQCSSRFLCSWTLLYLNPQKVVIVGASVHIRWATRGHLALGASWGHHMTSRERKKTGGHLLKNTRSRYSSRVAHWPGYPRYGNTTRSRFRSPIHANLTLDMVVYHDGGPSTSTRLAGACVVARLRTVTASHRPPRGGLRRLGREGAQKPVTLTSRVSKVATTRLQPCREPARSSQPP